MKTNLNPLTVALCAGLSLVSAGYGQSRAVSQGTRVQSWEANSAAQSRPAANNTGAPDGIARIGGQLVYVKDRRSTLLTGPQRFAEGLTLQRNGEILLEDGRLVGLREGQMVTLAGEVRDAPRNIEMPPPTLPDTRRR